MINEFFLRKFFIIFIILLILPSVVFAQEGAIVDTPTPEDREEQLKKQEEELQQLQEEISEYQDQLETKQREIQVIDSEIAGIEVSISSLEQEIQESDDVVAQLAFDIQEMEERIVQQEARVSQKRRDLGEILKVVQQLDHISYVELFLMQTSFSDYFNLFEQLITFRASFSSALNELTRVQEELLFSQDQLYRNQQYEQEQRELLEAKKLLLSQYYFDAERERSENVERSQQYEKLLADAEAAKGEVEQNIYRLQIAGVDRDFSLDEIVDLAKTVGNMTRVRPAFLMAVLKQESNLGSNTGTANYKDAYTCNGKHDENDDYIQSQIVAFRDIAESVGRDPETTLVSACPGYGTGGAMGPAQFMPLTWRGYEDDVRRITGDAVADPWNLTHAMVAMGVKLAHGGADRGTRDGEVEASLIYFSGSVNHKFDWYAESIQSLAEEYEKQM